MEQQPAALNALKPVDDLAPQHLPDELEKDFEGFYAIRKDAEKVLYLTRGADTEAFMDHGSHIHILTREPAEQKQSIQAAIEIAKERGWRELEVTGSEDFRRQVWMEASLAGIQVKGYVPSPEDKAELEKLRPGSSAAELEPSKIAAVALEQKPEPTWKVEDKEGMVTITRPDGQAAGYGGLPAILNDQDLPDDIKLQAAKLENQIQARKNDPMPAHEMRVGSQHDVADAVANSQGNDKGEEKEALFPDSKARADHELFAKLGSAKERLDASRDRPEPNPGNDLAADTSRLTHNSPGR